MSARDVTPEATEAVLEKKAPGLVHQMLSSSLEVTPLASSSRATAGIRGKTLIVNLPGSKKGSSECLSFISQSLSHCLDVLNDQKNKVEKTHDHLQNGASSSKAHQCPHMLPMSEGNSKV